MLERGLTERKRRKEFIWAMTGMAAAQVGDTNSLTELLRNYETEYCEEREYPLYTGEAGWICMECEKLYEIYERKLWIGQGESDCKDLQKQKNIYDKLKNEKEILP